MGTEYENYLIVWSNLVCKIISSFNMGFVDVFKRVLGPLKRPFKNYNVAHRAEKVLRKQENIPNPAPKHASSVTPIKQFREENPELLEAMQTKSDDLHERLKSVYL